MTRSARFIAVAVTRGARFIAVAVTRGARLAAASVGAALLLAACTPQAPRPVPAQIARAQATWPSVTPAAVQRGRTLFLSRCTACHTAPNPASRTPQTWATQLGKMAGRAHLNDDERELILAYLRSASER